MTETIVAIVRAARFGQMAATLPPGARHAGPDLVAPSETNHEAVRAARREAPLRGAVHPLERHRLPRGVVLRETPLPYRVAGVRSSPRIDRIASHAMGRH